jgi:hypothetical protein
MSEQLSVTGPVHQPSIELTPAAYEAQRVVLAGAITVKDINDINSADHASRVLSELKGLEKAIEASKAANKRPIIDAGRLIDTIVKDYLGPVQDASRRISALLGTYQDNQRRKAERARQEAAEVEAAAIAEKQKAQAELAAAGELTAEAIDTLNAEAADKIADAQISAMQATGPQVAGVSLRAPKKFEVIDIKALFKARPELCLIEPNKAAIRAILKQETEIPGLRIWTEAAAVVRSAAPVAIEQYDY